MLKRHVPFIGLAASVCLFAVAGLYYPGGTTDSANTVGFDWTRNYISSLFASTALNGAPNTGRLVAIPAMFLFCASVGALFKSISNTVTSRRLKKTIEIFGIGSMVYAFLIVTRMHNLMIDIALPFSFIAMLAILQLLHAGRRALLLLAGAVSLALTLVTATMYYEHLLPAFLPIMQKVSLIGSVGWLLAVYYAMLGQVTEANMVPERTVEPTR
jgi:hypothetical protein